MPRSTERPEFAGSRIIWPGPNVDPAWNDILERLSREDLFQVSKATLQLQKAQLEAQLQYTNILSEVIAKYG